MCPEFYERFVDAHRRADELLKKIGTLLAFLRDTDDQKHYPRVTTHLGTEIGLLPAARLKLFMLARHDVDRQLAAYEKLLLEIMPLPPRQLSEECAALMAEDAKP